MTTGQIASGLCGSAPVMLAVSVLRNPHRRPPRLQSRFNEVKDHGLKTSYREIPGRHDWFLWRDFLGQFPEVMFQ